MELTREEMQWVKENYAREQVALSAQQKNELIKQARQAVADSFKERLEAVKDDPVARKTLIEEMTIAANEAEAKIP